MMERPPKTSNSNVFRLPWLARLLSPHRRGEKKIVGFPNRRTNMGKGNVSG
jgi:hypothetical protein